MQRIGRLDRPWEDRGEEERKTKEWRRDRTEGKYEGKERYKRDRRTGSIAETLSIVVVCLILTSIRRHNAAAKRPQKTHGEICPNKDYHPQKSTEPSYGSPPN